jgi:ATP-dependent RNA/DNA helicase IGHMBP2
MTDAIIRDFCAKQRELLELELRASNIEQEVGKGSKQNGGGGGKHQHYNEEDREDRASHVLSHLEASEVSVGMFGRTVVELSLWSQVTDTASASAQRLLPAHRFTVGDEVEIRSKGQAASKAVSGVISAVTDTFVSVALFQDRKSQSFAAPKNSKQQPAPKSGGVNQDQEESDLLNTAPLTLVPRSSVEVHNKLLKALNDLEKHGVDHPIAGKVVQAMFLEDQSDRRPVRKESKSQPFNPNLDQSQLEAIDFALQPDLPVALIHGPPGSGKTSSVAELIRQAVYHHGMRVLVTAPSNVAVDNILERLVLPIEDSQPIGNRSSKKQQRLKTVRLGHPARIKASILTHSLEHLVQSSEGTEIVQNVRQELQSFLKILKNPKARSQDKRAAYQQIKSLRKEVRVREEKVVQELLTSANVVLATTVGASAGVLEKITNASHDGNPTGFDLVIIDEAAQALEASCWIPILRGKKVVLAGDHKQLPPTIKSKDQKVTAGLSNTLFERLMKLYEKKPERISRMLQIQYRMNHVISDWASQAMYNGKLLTHESVRDRTLRQLTSVQQHVFAKGADRNVDEEDTMDTILVLIDTAGCDMHEMETAAGSRFNEGEASVVNQHVRKLLALGVAQNEIAIITPYNGQVELLRNMILPDFPKVEIRSVDGFQGGEREAVILSLVRSSERAGANGIGFLRDDRRQNVAVTRAKRHLAVVCDTETVSKSSFIASLIRWIEQNGQQRSAIEFMSEGASDDKQKKEFQKTEADLMKLVESSFASVPPKEKKMLSKSKISSASAPRDKKLEEAKRKSLMDKIAAFNEKGALGDEMALNSELTSYDRRLVHEFAEQLGLGHRSEGIEGVDRKIILAIQEKAGPSSIILQQEVGFSSEMASVVPDSSTPSQVEESVVSSANFLALAMDESDSDDDTNDREDAESSTLFTPAAQVPEMNSLLAQLARERAAGQQQNTSSLQLSTAAGTKTKKKKGQKLGGTGKPAPLNQEDNLDDLDDMAFLDAQIEKAQNAHGRKVAGTGKQYRTVVNGILNGKPEPKSTPKNKQANAALQAKLRDAESSRKKKTKKK